MNPLQEEIAKRMGWTDIREDSMTGEPYGFLPNSKPSFIPNWTEDMADAWALFEEIRQRLFTVRLLVWNHTDTCYIEGEARHGHHEPGWKLQIKGENVLDAICKAWLEVDAWEKEKGEVVE